MQENLDRSVTDDADMSELVELPGTTAPDGGEEPKTGNYSGELERLSRQVAADREEIAGLQAQSVIDHEMISALAEQGELDRAEIGNLKQALVSARKIGAAMGILMATHHIDQEAAFVMLRAASQHTHRKLRDVADDVVYTGLLDEH